MKIDLSKSGLENVLTLVLANNPRFRGTATDTTVQVQPVINHPSGKNTFAVVTASGEGVYAEHDAVTVTFDRRALAEYIDGSEELLLPNGIAEFDIVDTVIGSMRVIDERIRGLVTGTRIPDTDDPYRGRVYLEVDESIAPCIYPNMEVLYVIDRPVRPPQVLDEDLVVTDLVGFL